MEKIKILPDEIKTCTRLQKIDLSNTDLDKKEIEKLREYFPDIEEFYLPYIPGEDVGR